MADLRQTLAQGRKHIGLFLGAGAPMAVRVPQTDCAEEGNRPPIPDVKGLTTAVLKALSPEDQRVLRLIRKELSDKNVEALLTQVRRLAQAIGGSEVHGLDGCRYRKLAHRICKEIGKIVGARLPCGPNPYSELVSWIAGTQRRRAVEIFTPNYDLLLEEAFERSQTPYFDGFSGAHQPFFDAASVSANDFPPRWSRVWKLHGSLGWSLAAKTVVRTGQRAATQLIYPDHLKYDHVTRLPYSALFERLRTFLTTPDTLLIVSGFSFSDSHICAVMSEALAANAHTAIFAFQYRDVEEEHAVSKLARSRPNLSVYARDGGIINGLAGRWRPSHRSGADWETIRETFWSGETDEGVGEFLLGDFAELARFLAFVQASQVRVEESIDDQRAHVPETPVPTKGRPSAWPGPDLLGEDWSGVRRGTQCAA